MITAAARKTLLSISNGRRVVTGWGTKPGYAGFFE
jgi:hypothetical protein